MPQLAYRNSLVGLRQSLAVLLSYCALGLCLVGHCDSAFGAEPLHVRVDRHIESKLDCPPAPPASDEDFVRRVYLDLTGKIPSLKELQSFLAETSADRRTKLIDRLLDSAEYGRRMQYVFDVMFNERRSGAGVPPAQWQEYLRTSFAENKPYDQLAREILAADGTVNRPAVKFYLDRKGDLTTLTRDVGRVFLGIDVQCAQCHDHPLIDDYLQTDYYGISAFLSRGVVFTQSKKMYYAEKAVGEVSFKSVFDSDVDEKNFKPRLRGGKILEEPKPAKGLEYFGKPSKKVRPVPRFSRRKQMARMATDGTNAYFNANIVNRLWHLMMGRGLVHPPGLHHEENPASHPELLDELSREFVAKKFDVKYFLRELALSKTYQRSSVIPSGMTDKQSAEGRYAVALLRPLSPEQLAWSLMEASGMCEPIRAAEAARFDNDPRMRDILAISANARNLRAVQIEKAVNGKLRANVSQFISLYGGAPGEPEQDFQVTVHQALFFSNGGTIRSWATKLSGRLQSNNDLQAVAEEMYRAILSRRPSEEERLEAVEYLLRKAKNRAEGIQEIAWGLMASTEFRFNH